LLKALGTLSGLRAEEPVLADEAITLTLEELGMTEDDLGDDSNGRPRMRIVMNQTFHRLIKKHDLGDSPRRGRWALTDKGVQTAALLLGQDVPAVDVDSDDKASRTPADGDAPTTPDPVPAPTTTDAGGTGVAYTLGEQVNTYNPDPYIRGLAIAATAAGGGAGSEAKITLAQLSGKEVFPALVAETKSSDPKISKAAVKLLSERRDPGYLELMMKTAQSKDEQAAASALAALRSSGTAKEIPALRKLLFEIDGSLKPTVAGTIAGIANRDPDGADIAAFLNSTPKITGEARNAMVSIWD